MEVLLTCVNNYVLMALFRQLYCQWECSCVEQDVLFACDRTTGPSESLLASKQFESCVARYVYGLLLQPNVKFRRTSRLILQILLHCRTVTS